MRMCPHPFFEATPPGAAPGPLVETGARVRHFRGCNHLPKARRWLDLAPLSPRTALRTNPLSDLDGSMELAEPPLVGMMRLLRAIRHRLGTINGTRCALKGKIGYFPTKSSFGLK